MKTKFYLLIWLGALTFSVNAQPDIPNASFENWETKPPYVAAPVSWTTDAYTAFPRLVQQVTDAHTGNYAVRIGVSKSGSSTLLGSIYTRFGYTPANPIVMYAWVKVAVVDSDRGFISAEATNTNPNTIVIGNTYLTSAQNTNVWKQVADTLLHPLGTLTDTVSILISMYNAKDTTSYFLIDDISFSDFLSSVNNLKKDFAAENMYPNPALTVENMIYSLNGTAPVLLEVYNIQGGKMETVIDTKQTAGRYRAEIPTTDLANGIYIAALSLNGRTIREKFIVQH